MVCVKLGDPLHGFGVLRIPAERGHDGVGFAGHGERSRSQLLLKLAGTENRVNLAVNVLAVEFWLLNLTVPLYLRVF